MESHFEIFNFSKFNATMFALKNKQHYLEKFVISEAKSGKFIGPPGPPGPQGQRGPSGLKGQDGAKGDRGELELVKVHFNFIFDYFMIWLRMLIVGFRFAFYFIVLGRKGRCWRSRTTRTFWIQRGTRSNWISKRTRWPSWNTWSRWSTRTSRN